MPSPSPQPSCPEAPREKGLLASLQDRRKAGRVLGERVNGKNMFMGRNTAALGRRAERYRGGTSCHAFPMGAYGPPRPASLSPMASSLWPELTEEGAHALSFPTMASRSPAFCSFFRASLITKMRRQRKLASPASAETLWSCWEAGETPVGPKGSL